MAKFRSIPKEIEAVRFDPEGVHKGELPARVRRHQWPGTGFWFDAPSVDEKIRPGDWIVGEEVVPDRGDGLAPLGHEPVEQAESLIIERKQLECANCGNPISIVVERV